MTKTLCDGRIYHHVSCSQLFGFFPLGLCQRQPRNREIHRQVCWKRHRISGVVGKERNIGFVGFLGNVEPKWCRKYWQWLCCEISQLNPDLRRVWPFGGICFLTFFWEGCSPATPLDEPPLVLTKKSELNLNDKDVFPQVCIDVFQQATYFYTLWKETCVRVVWLSYLLGHDDRNLTLQWIFQSCGSTGTDLLMLRFTEYITISGLPLPAMSLSRCITCKDVCVQQSHAGLPFGYSLKPRLHTKINPYSYNKNRAIASGGPVVAFPLSKSVSPFHIWPSGCCIHPILYLKKISPLVVFGPPAEKSWRCIWIKTQKISVMKKNIRSSF